MHYVLVIQKDDIDYGHIYRRFDESVCAAYFYFIFSLQVVVDP